MEVGFDALYRLFMKYLIPLGLAFYVRQNFKDYGKFAEAKKLKERFKEIGHHFPEDGGKDKSDCSGQ